MELVERIVERLGEIEGAEAHYVVGCLFRCAACLVQALFVLDERYFVKEKGSVKTADSFPLSPEAFEDSFLRAHRNWERPDPTRRQRSALRGTGRCRAGDIRQPQSFE